MPSAVKLETANAILTPKLDAERKDTIRVLAHLGYETWWQVVDASGHGAPQERRRAVLVGLRDHAAAAAFR